MYMAPATAVNRPYRRGSDRRVIAAAYAVYFVHALMLLLSADARVCSDIQFGTANLRKSNLSDEALCVRKAVMHAYDPVQARVA